MGRCSAAPAGSCGSSTLSHPHGLVSRWNLDRYPGLVQRHPSLVAGVLFRDFNRGRDDVTVVAARGRAA